MPRGPKRFEIGTDTIYGTAKEWSGWLAAKMSDSLEISNAALRYMERSQPLHALLRQVLTQVAGCTLALTMKSRPDQGVDGAIHLARKALARALHDLHGLRVPGEADRHFHHMKEAAEAVEATSTCWRPGSRTTPSKSATV